MLGAYFRKSVEKYEKSVSKLKKPNSTEHPVGVFLF